MAAFAAATASFVPALASAAPVPANTTAAAVLAEAASLRDSTVWFANGQDAADRFLDLLATSEVDGIDPRQFDIRALQRTVRRAADNPAEATAAGHMLDQSLIRYVAAVRGVVPSSEWTVNDREALPVAPSSAALLQQAAASSSMGHFIETMPWMHENYVGLRRALLDAGQRGDQVAATRLQINLDRVRMLPAAAGAQRYVLVNTAAQRLYMYENGKVVGSMRVVVGKATQQTPMMAAMIRFAAVNPYWNVPSDLAAERIAPGALKDGVSYLKQQGYVVLSDWTDEATVVDPSTIDWRAVADGKVQIRVRQDPGSINAMGRMKFMFPNEAGVYLHDTPNKELLKEDARLFSGGCVRLEDAPRLAKWLYGHPLTVTKGMKPEQHVDLDKPVPVYLAYLTAEPSGDQAVFYDDIYGRDAARLGAARMTAR